MDRLEKKNIFDGSLRFGAKAFFEKSGRAKQAGFREEEEIFKYFQDPATGMIKDEFLARRDCICGSNDGREVFIKQGFKFIICGCCGFLYVNPILKEEVAAEFYKNEASWFEVLENPVQSEMDTLKFSYGLGVMEEYIKAGSLLDIGCGNCGFLELARKNRWSCTGIEFNLKALEIAKVKGLDVVNYDINAPHFDNKEFDAVTLWEVLEHVSRPRAMIRRVNQLLRPGGLIFILVPNRDSLLNLMLREKSNTFTGHCHINFFNAGIMNRVLEEEGFTTLHTETIISELGNIRNYLNYEDAYEGSAEEGPDFLTPAFIHDNLLGCKLLVLARKNR